LLKENRDKLPEADAKAIETAIEETRRAIGEGNVERINAAVESLTKASHQVAEVLYKSQQAAAGAAGGPGAAGGGQAADGSAGGAQGSGGQGQDNVVDAEFVDVDESKRPN